MVLNTVWATSAVEMKVLKRCFSKNALEFCSQGRLNGLATFSLCQENRYTARREGENLTAGGGKQPRLGGEKMGGWVAVAPG